MVDHVVVDGGDCKHLNINVSTDVNIFNFILLQSMTELLTIYYYVKIYKKKHYRLIMKRILLKIKLLGLFERSASALLIVSSKYLIISTLLWSAVTFDSLGDDWLSV